jgi:L-amino acid N-acyltransferase YncA
MTNPHIIIRPATRADIPVIIKFQQQLSEETEQETLDLAKLTPGVTAVFDDPNKGQYYVAEAEDKVIGCLITGYEWSDWGNAKTMWLASLYVDKDWRGQGVFKKFYSYLKNIVESGAEYRGIRLYVNKTNHTAELAYQKAGMNGQHYNLYEWMK